MKWFRRVFPTPSRTTSPRSFRPAVEPLETRTMLSAATTAVAIRIVKSGENYTNFVASEYQRFLRRAADPSGLNFWVNQLLAGRAPEWVEAAFVSSGEYFFKSGNTPPSWVNALYQDLLNRTPAAFEVNFWVTQLASGFGTFQIATAFSTSGERQGIIVTEAYATYLARSPEPGAIIFWLGQFSAGLNRADFTALIVGSTEFFLRNGGNNTSFIIGVYNSVLRRTPSQVEINFWLNFINQFPCC